MAFEVRLTLDGEEALKAALQKVYLEARTSKLFQTMGNDLVQEIRLAMSQGQDPWGGIHEPLKSRVGVPLLDTRQHLYNRLTYNVLSNGVEVGLMDPVGYSKVHQFGAVIVPKRAKFLKFRIGNDFIFTKRVEIPARPYLPIRNDRVELPEAWGELLLKRIKAAIQP